MNNVQEFIKSEEYDRLLNDLKASASINVLDSYSPAMEKLDESNFRLSGLSVDELVEFTASHTHLIIEFSKQKLKKFHGVTFPEEFPKGEEPEVEVEQPIAPNSLGYARGFLMMYVVELMILEKDPDELLSYLKKRRIPKPADYAKSLQEVWSRSTKK